MDKDAGNFGQVLLAVMVLSALSFLASSLAEMTTLVSTATFLIGAITIAVMIALLLLFSCTFIFIIYRKKYRKRRQPSEDETSPLLDGHLYHKQRRNSFWNYNIRPSDQNNPPNVLRSPVNSRKGDTVFPLFKQGAGINKGLARADTLTADARVGSKGLQGNWEQRRKQLLNKFRSTDGQIYS